jgi:hypothetical protein
MSLTQHIGYGQFRLEDLLPGESFARFDGTLARVCFHQRHRTLNHTPRHLHSPDHILVWINAGTSNATRVYLHRTALVHALTPEQARTIQARIRKRKERR